LTAAIGKTQTAARVTNRARQCDALIQINAADGKLIHVSALVAQCAYLELGGRGSDRNKGAAEGRPESSGPARSFGDA
jgi:hypothetical protein